MEKGFYATYTHRTRIFYTEADKALMWDSESDNSIGDGDGDTSRDIREAEIGTADVDVLLRAERNGRGDGRTYTLLYRATDSSGNKVDAEVSVFVPHDEPE